MTRVSEKQELKRPQWVTLTEITWRERVLVAERLTKVIGG